MRWFSLLLAVILPLAVLLPHTVSADPVRMDFSASNASLTNPERGFWKFAADDFLKVDPAELANIRSQGLSLAYAIVRLDDCRDATLPQPVLDALQHSFALTRQAGLKVILRFAYNYSQTSSEYETAEDVTLPVVLGHIAQLGPVIAANADTIAVVQAGFIGAWGESHSSSNGLDSPGAKAAIRDALAASIPAPLQIQGRYPADLLTWPPTAPVRFGLHNDCFLSSDTDVGTYSEDPETRTLQRAHITTLTDSTFFSGETCDADPAYINSDCADALADSATFHLSALGLDYYRVFHDRWVREGCLAQIDSRMGYRLRLVSADIDGAGIRITLTNDGWARALQPRHLRIGEPGSAGVALGPQTLNQIGAGQMVTLFAELPMPLPEHLCLTAPDTSPRLAPIPNMQFVPPMVTLREWDETKVLLPTASVCLDPHHPQFVAVDRQNDLALAQRGGVVANPRHRLTQSYNRLSDTSPDRHRQNAANRT